MGKGGKQRELSTEEMIKGLENGKGKEKGSTGARRRGEKGALEQGGEDQELGG